MSFATKRTSEKTWTQRYFVFKMNNYFTNFNSWGSCVWGLLPGVPHQGRIRPSSPLEMALGRSQGEPLQVLPRISLQSWFAFCPIFQRPVAWHSSSERKQGDSWEGLIMWESSSCHCQPGAASIVILVSPFLGCLSRGLAGTIHLGCQFC